MAMVTLTDTEKFIINQYKIHFNYSHFTKFKSMEKYMNKITFLLKFINIDLTQSKISFDYKSLNAFEEDKWIKEVEKYNINYKKEINITNNKIDKDEKKEATLLNNNKNKFEYQGDKKGTSIIIEIYQPIILIRYIDKNGKIHTKKIEVLENEENKLIFNKVDNNINLTKNLFEISLYHKKKESE